MGTPPAEELTCARDGSSTRLTCVECKVPICTVCLVRTPVGMKCASCGGQPGTVATRSSRRRWLLLLPVVTVALVVAVPRLLSSPETSIPPTVNPSAENRPAAPYTFGGIGREVVDGDLSFLVRSIDCTPAQVVGATPHTAQGTFCVLALSIRNVGRRPVTLDGKNQALEDAMRRRFGVDPAVTADHPANNGLDMFAAVVNPGNELTGVLVFDVPPDTKPVSVSLHSGSAGFGAIIFLA